LAAIDLRFSLHGLHGRQLWQRHKSAGRDAPKAVPDAVDPLLPERSPKPDREPFHHKPPPARRKEMPQLVDHNHQIKEKEDLEEDDDDSENLHRCWNAAARATGNIGTAGGL